MAKISGKETKPEIIVRKYLFSKGFRYRKNVKTLPGSPDIVLYKYKTIIFVQGCFWHGHNCNASKFPETRKDFWLQKILDNVERDIRNQLELKTLGWKVLIVWQCELRNKDLRLHRLNDLVTEIFS
jgi:DNA mismatch endonuclease (patch repair protein)